MPAQRAFFFGANAENGVTGFLVERVGLQLDAETSPDFKGVSQHQVFGLGVDGGALPGGCDPGGTDLDPPVDAVDVHEAGAADGIS